MADILALLLYVFKRIAGTLDPTLRANAIPEFTACCVSIKIVSYTASCELPMLPNDSADLAEAFQFGTPTFLN